MEWIKVEDSNPGYRNFVWGNFKEEVCIVEHSLSDEEYFDYCHDGLWYSLDHEKTGCITHWMPIVRPKLPEPLKEKECNG